MNILMNTYFLHDETAQTVKIGKSLRPEKRLRDLQVGSAHKLKLVLVLAGDQERAMHQMWARHRLSGEWFQAVPDLLTFIYDKSGNSPYHCKTDTSRFMHWLYVNGF